jgi:ABC-type dipeptide/oligopeptide/nickel transport system ATPase component
MALLEIDGLQLEFVARHGVTRVLHGIDLAVDRGQIVGVVGETGSGKSITGMSVARIVPAPPARYTGGAIRFDGIDIMRQDEKAMRRLRGNRIGMVFQDPSSNLNPALTIREQMVDVGLHVASVAPAKLGLAAGAGRSARRRAALDNAIAMLERVGVRDAAARIDGFPHQFSGGMRQRVMIAMALLGRPDLLIADEPTTALDVSVQAQVLELIYGLVKEFDLGVLMITHNMGVVAQLCTHVAVMSHGRIVEQGATRAVLKTPSHDYTRRLLAAIPAVHGRAPEVSA